MTEGLLDIRVESVGQKYPRWLLKEGESALCLFAAGFHGRQDAIWMAEAGMKATCVDTDHEKLGRMALMYPEGWEYVHGDVFAYTEDTERVWDVVSLDPPTNLFDDCAARLQRWCDLARRAVVLGVGTDTSFPTPPGWVVAEVKKRSNFKGGVFWAALVPE